MILPISSTRSASSNDAIRRSTQSFASRATWSSPNSAAVAARCECTRPSSESSCEAVTAASCEQAFCRSIASSATPVSMRCSRLEPRASKPCCN
eukprot:scaffold93823_cov26-Tisochrysis_lutea.AAC.3